MNYHEKMVEEFRLCREMIEKEELKKNTSIIEEFKAFVKRHKVFLENDCFRWAPQTGLVVLYPCILILLYPDIEVDKEGLVDFEKLKKTIKSKSNLGGVLQGDKCIVYPSSFFRRGYFQFNNFAPRFVELFFNYQDPSVKKYLAMDSDMIRIDLDGGWYEERDRWYGPRFQKKIENIDDGNSKLAPPSNIDEDYIKEFFANVIFIDIKWETKKNIKSFQLEEFKSVNVTIDYDGKIVHPVRYIHSEYDLMKKVFRHFDGAMHFYTSEEYYLRRESDLNYNSKNNNHIKSASKKLFKIEGTIHVETWIEFVSHFLSGNPLIHEYFEGQLPKFIIDIINKIKKH